MFVGDDKWGLRTSITAIGGLSFSLAIARVDYTWVLMSIFYILLMHSILKLKADPTEKEQLGSYRKRIFIWSLPPLLMGSTGITGDWEAAFLVEIFAFTALTSVFAVMLLLIIEKRTELRSNIFFSGVFVYSFPIAIGAARAVAFFLSDQFYGTEYFLGNTHFMLELMLITILSFYLGFAFKNYLKNSEYNIFFGRNEKMEMKSSFEGHREDFLDFLNSIFNRFDRSGLIRVSTGFQWGMYGVIIYGLIVSNHPVTAWAIFSFGFSIIPAVVSRSTRNGFPTILYFWTTLALFVFTVGRPLGFYSLLNWWAEITHFLSGSAVALLLFSILMYVDEISRNLSLPSWSIPVFVLLFILPVGVVWEIAEFYIDLVYDSGVQGGLVDTAYDILFNFFGAGFSLLTISFFSTMDFSTAYRAKVIKVLNWLKSESNKILRLIR